MTARAIGFVLAAIFLFFLSGATHVGWVRIVDALLWGMLGLSVLLQFLSVVHIDVRRRLLAYHRRDNLPAPMVDDTLDVEIELHNRWFFPRFFISMAFDTGDDSAESRWQKYFVADLKGHGTTKVVSKFRCFARGIHRFSPVILESRAPFGLFRRRNRQEAALSVLVYPRVFPMSGLAIIEGGWGSAERAKRSRYGQEAIGSRHYYPGDPIRHIHWRNTARLGKLAVKELEDPANRSLAIAFSTRLNQGEGSESTLEYTIKLAASIGVATIEAGESVTLVAGGRHGDWSDPEPFLRELALLEQGDPAGLDGLLQSSLPSSPVVAIFSDADHEAMTALARHQPHLPALAAIVLEGFGGQVPSDDAVRRSGTGIPTVTCTPGRIAETLRAVERLGWGPDRDLVGASRPGAAEPVYSSDGPSFQVGRR